MSWEEIDRIYTVLKKLVEPVPADRGSPRSLRE
jgi:hypothetical protein